MPPKTKCAFCTKKSLLSFHCDCCQKSFCISHRMPELHHCEKDYRKKELLKESLGHHIIPLKVDKI